MTTKTSTPERETTKNRPAHEVRFGAVRAVVWSNATENGPMMNVTVSRSYKTKDGDGNDVWRDSDSFGRDDLLPLAKALDHAHTWICQQQRNLS